MQPRELADKIAAGQPPAVIDVRTGFEFRAGHIPGAINAPVWKILLRLAALPPDRQSELVVLSSVTAMFRFLAVTWLPGAVLLFP